MKKETKIIPADQKGDHIKGDPNHLQTYLMLQNPFALIKKRLISGKNKNKLSNNNLSKIMAKHLITLQYRKYNVNCKSN